VSTRVDGAKVLVLVIARATLSAGPVHLSLSAREGPAPETWRYNLTDGPDHRAASGRVAGRAGHMDVLRYAAGICAASYQPGTTERGLLEQFAADPARS
jgi:NAD(P)-dependent dehydrogenase (short-subunit alcohol dehydrogenase family)